MPQVFASAEALAAAVGSELGPTPWLEVTQERIDRFAGATGDHQWIHVDAERAKAGPFGVPIAHGYLTLSLLNHFVPHLLSVPSAALSVNCGCSKVRFPAPVPVGSRIRARAELSAVDPVEGGVDVVLRMSVEVEGSSKPACVAEAARRLLFP